MPGVQILHAATGPDSPDAAANRLTVRLPPSGRNGMELAALPVRTKSGNRKESKACQ